MFTEPSMLRRLARHCLRLLPLPAFALALLAAMWLAVFHQLDSERHSARRDAADASAALARVLSEHVSHILRQTDHASQLFKLKYEETDGHLRLPEFSRRNGLLDSVLPAALELPMALYDRAGALRDSANGIVPDQVAQLPYFAMLARDSADAAVFSTPVVDARTHKWHIQVARRLNDAHGRFDGIIVVMIDPLLFVDDYDRLNLGDRDALALLARAGGLTVGRVGEQLFIDDHQRFEPARAAGSVAGEIAAIPALDPVARVYGASDMPRFGLAAVVGIAEHAALLRFQRQRATYLDVTAGATLLIVLVVALLMGQSARLRASIRAARTAQATLRAASDASLDALLIFDAAYGPDGGIEDFIFVDVNERGAAMLGRSRAQLIGVRAFASLSRMQRTGFLPKYIQVMASGTALEEEVELPGDGASAHWIHHQIVPLKDGVAVTSRDIGARKRDELAVRTGQAQMAAMINASPLGLVRADVHGNCTFVNPRFESITGLTREQALGRGWMGALHPDDRVKLAGLFNHQRQQEAPFQDVLRCVRPDGSVVWAALKVAAVRIGERIEGFAGTLDDITVRREAELALRASEARLRTIADTIPAMVAYVDAHEVYRFHNLAYDREFGRASLAVPGRTVRETMSEQRYRFLQPYIARVLAGETLIFEEQDQEDGAERTQEVTYIPQLGEDGESVIGFHIMRQDITSQQREKKRLLKLAQLDQLTGLANRAGFLSRLDSAMRDAAIAHRLMALMYMDIDRFKPVNDTYGHAVGDKLLKAFSGRLTHALRAGDVVARLGGDEFTIIMEGLAREDDAAATATKIVQAMREPFELDGVTVSVSVSIGLSYYRDGPHDPEALLKQADMLLYQAKQAGRNTCRVAA